MTRHRRRRVIGLGALAMLLSGCIFGFPPFYPGDPGLAIGDELRVAVTNEGDTDVVITFAGDFPLSYAVGAGDSGAAILYGGVARAVTIADAECAELDVLELDPDNPPAAFRIADGAVLAVEPPPDVDALPLLLEHYECGAGGGPVLAGDPVPGASGVIGLEGEDGSAWTLEPATAELTPVRDPVAPAGFPYDTEHTWSPDGSQVAFSRFDADGGQGVYVLELGAAEPRLLGEDGATPAWSPDGSRIAFIVYDPFDGGQVLMVADAEGGEATELAGEVASFAWSPDGSRIAFVSLTVAAAAPMLEPAEKLRVVDVTSATVTALAPASAYGRRPSWSPDGELIAFVGGTFERGEAHIVDADGGEPRRIRAPAGKSIDDLAWSPDGSWIGVIVGSAGLVSFSTGVGLIDPTSGELRVLIEAENTFYESPTWSPDGTHLAVIRGRDLPSEVVVVDAADGTETAVASGVVRIDRWR